jgi:hypothetical protein
MEDFLLKIKKVLQDNPSYNDEIAPLMREIYTRATIIDRIFNPLDSKGEEEEYFLDIGLNEYLQEETTITLKREEKEENELYYHTPAI